MTPRALADTNRPIEEWEADGGRRVAEAIAAMSDRQRAGLKRKVGEACRDWKAAEKGKGKA